MKCSNMYERPWKMPSIKLVAGGTYNFTKNADTIKYLVKTCYMPGSVQVCYILDSFPPTSNEYKTGAVLPPSIWDNRGTEGLSTVYPQLVSALWCWRGLLKVPWTARSSNPSILKEINPDYSLEELILNLNSNIWATWWEEPTHQKRSWCQEKLKAREEGGRKWELDSIIDSVDISLSKIWETMEDRGAWNTAVHRVTE